MGCAGWVGHKGCAGPWALFWALKKAPKRVNPLKKTLLRANPLFWVLKKVFKKVSLIKRALKKVLLWVINSNKCSKKNGLLKKVKFESSAQKRAHLSYTPKKMLKRVGCTRNLRPVSEWLSDWQGKAMIFNQINLMPAIIIISTSSSPFIYCAEGGHWIFE